MRGPPVRTTKETSNERIASASVTKERRKEKQVSVYLGARLPQSIKEKDYAGRSAAAGTWKR